MPENKNFEASQIKMHLNKKMISEMEASLGQDDVDNVYREFTDSLKKLRDKTEDYYTQDNNGQFPELSKDQLKELRDFYETAAEKAQNVIAAEADKNDEKAKNFKDIANVLKPLIEADQKALGTAAEADIKMSLPELIFQGRSAAIHVGRAGAQMSDRVILELDNVYDPDTGMTKPKKGYFTKEVPLQIEAQFDNMCRKLEAKFGDDYKDIIDQIRKAPIENKMKLFNDKKCINALDPDNNDPILASSKHNMSVKQVANMYNQITWGPLFIGTDQIRDVSRALTQLTNKDDFFDFQDEVQKGLWGFVVQYSLLSKHSKNAFSLNLEEGAPLASRNAAMYDMAKLFGVQDIVAEAKSVTLMQDGKEIKGVLMSEVADALGKPELLARSRNVQVLSGGEIMEGVFMEKAKGEDINYIEPDRGLGGLTEENSEAAFNNAQGLKSLADLQVIDYICNNTDRHTGNFFYQFDNSDPQKPKLIGVQGIDNDMSFGLGKQNPDHTNVTVMTEEMAEKIRDGKYIEEIENRLKKSALSKAAQKAVLDRIDDLKTDLNDGKIKVVKNDEWGSGDYSFEKLKTKGIFREANNARKYAVKNNKKLKNQAEQNAEQDEKENAPLTFAKAAKVKSFGMNAEEKKEYKELCTEAEREFTQKMDEVISRAQPQDDAEWDNVGTHKEFIRKLKRSCKDMKEVLGAADPLFHKSSSQYKDVKNSMNELISSVNTISKRLDKNRDPNAEMTEDEMQKLYAQFTALSRSADTYQGIRRYEEGSTLSQQKYRACDVLKKNKPLIVVSLLNMHHKAHIKDMDSAKNKLQVSLTKMNELAQKETDKNALLKYAAQEIYYKSVQKSDFYTVKNNEQLIKALSPLNRRDGIKLIMNDPAFKTIADKSEAEVKALCAEPDKLYNAFIVSKAKDKEFKNKFGEKQIKEDIAEKQKENKPNLQNEGPKLNHK